MIKKFMCFITIIFSLVMFIVIGNATNVNAKENNILKEGSIGLKASNVSNLISQPLADLPGRIASISGQTNEGANVRAECDESNMCHFVVSSTTTSISSTSAGLGGGTHTCSPANFVLNLSTGVADQEIYCSANPVPGTDPTMLQDMQYLVTAETDPYINDATLKSLYVIGGTKVSSTESVYNYTVPYSYTTATIVATSNGKATITGAGQISLPVVSRLYTRDVVVTSSGCKSYLTSSAYCKTNTFTVNITRLPASTDNSISNLRVKNILATKQSDTVYNVTVPYDVTTITPSDVTMTPATGATVTKTMTLQLSTTQVKQYTFSVRSESGSTKTYTINITRSKNPDNSINNLKVKNVSANLVSNGVYSVTLPYNIATIAPSDVTFTTAEGTTVTKTMTLPLLTTQINQYTFFVTSESGNVKTYTINITRSKNTDNSINNLKVKNIAATKQSDTVYNVTVPYNISTIAPEDVTFTSAEGATVNKTMTLQLSTTQVKQYTFTVTSESGSAKTYTINITRSKNTDNSISNLKVKNIAATKQSDGIYDVIIPKDITRIIPADVTFDIPENATVTKTMTLPIVIGQNNEYTFTVTSESGIIKNYKINITTSKNTDNIISNLKVKNVMTTSAGYTSTTRIYSVTLPYSVSVITPEDITMTLPEGATVNKTMTLQLQVNNNNPYINQYRFTVTSESGDIKNYVINITRQSASENNSISNLKVKNVATTLVSDGVYSVTLPATVGEVKPEDVTMTLPQGATVNKTMTLQLSTTQVKQYTFTVTSESGSAKTYTINITRSKNTDNSISNLKVYDRNATLVSDGVYRVKIDDILVKPENVTMTLPYGAIVNKTMTLNLPTLQEYQYYFSVTSESGDIKNYVINITRDAAPVLSEIKIDGKLIKGFNPRVFNYTVYVDPSITSVNISAKLMDSVPEIKLLTDLSQPFVLNQTEQYKSIEIERETDGFSLTYDVTIIKGEDPTPLLNSITIDGVEIPNFDKDVYEYTIDEYPFSKTEINIGATLGNSATSVEGTGVKNLATGNQEFIVTAVNGATRTEYKLKVSRAATISDDNSISNLKVKNVDANLVSDGVYRVYVPFEITEIRPEDVTMTIPKYATLNKTMVLPLTSGAESNYNFSVTSESGNIKNYTIVVYRDVSAYLKEIKIDGKLIKGFNSRVFDYTVYVDPATTSVNISAQTEDPAATILTDLSQPYVLTKEVSHPWIQVEAVDGQVVTYDVTIIKGEDPTPSLNSITIDGVEIPNFDKDVYEYTIDEYPFSKTEIDIGATLGNNATSIEGTGVKSLAFGEQEFIVTAVNGTTRTEYKLKVYRAATKSSDVSVKNVKVAGYPAKIRNGVNFTVYFPDSMITGLTKDDITFTTHPGATVVKDDELIPGEWYHFTVTAEDGVTTKTYALGIVDITIQKLWFVVTPNPYVKYRTYIGDDGTATVHVKEGYETLQIKYTPEGNFGLRSAIYETRPTDTIEWSSEQTSTKTFDKNVRRFYLAVSYVDYLLPTPIVEYPVDIIVEPKPYNFAFTATIIDKNTGEEYSYDVTNDPTQETQIVDPFVTPYIGENATLRITAPDPKVWIEFSTPMQWIKAGDEQIEVEITKDNQQITPDIQLRSPAWETKKFDISWKIVNENVNAEVVENSTKLCKNNNCNQPLNLGFDVNKTEYEFTNPYDITNANINLKALDKGTIEVIQEFDDEFKVAPEENIKKIKVSSESCKPEYANVKYLTCNEKIYTFKFIRQQPSIDNSVKKITVKKNTQEYTVIPKGDSEYDVVVPSEINDVLLNVTVDPTATVSADGINKTINLNNIGNNDHTFTITSESGVEKEYTIHIYKLSDIARLKTLNLTNDLVLDFAPDVYTYDITAPFKTKNTVISATPVDGSTIVSGTGDFELTNEDPLVNTREIVVNAENCDPKYATVPGNQCVSKTYTINIKRDKANTSSDVKTIKVTKDTTEYNVINLGNKEYRVNVGNDITDVLLNVTADPAATVSADGINKTINLNNIGNNDQTFTITSESGDIQTYTVHVYRLSNVADLESLTLTNGLTLNFDKATTTYDINAPYAVSNTQVNATAVSGATIKSGTGLFELAKVSPENNTRKVVVEAENCDVKYNSVPGNVCTTKEYTLNVTREAASSNALLKELKTDNVLVKDFDKNKFEYTLDNVPYDKTTIEVSAEVEDTNKAKVTSGTGSHNLNVGLNTIKVIVTAEDEQTTQEYIIKVTRNLKEEARLSSITIDGKEITGFDKDTYSYTIDAYPNSKTEINVGATTLDKDATVEGTGVKQLQTGTSQIVITGVAQDGKTTKEYTLNVTRAKNSDTTISDLKVKDVPATFVSDGVYSVTLPNNVTEVKPEDVTLTLPAGATINKTMTLPLLTTQNNEYSFSVTSEDGSIKTYIVNITREKSNNNNLSEIKLEGTLIDGFNKTKTSYQITVNGDVETANIAALTEDKTAKITTDLSKVFNLNIGVNTISIEVVAENDDVKTYTLEITRKEKTEARLTSITIDGKEIPLFDKDIYSYTIDAYPYTKTEINVGATTLDKDATVEGTGVKQLQTGTSQIVITGVAQDGKTRKEYTLNVTRGAASSNALLKELKTDNVLVKDFDKNKFEYTLDNVPYDKTTIEVSAEVEDTNKAKVTSGTGSHNLNVGLNTIKVIVTAEDGQTKQEYIIKVTRNLKEEARLSSITIDGKEITGFDKDTYSYTIDAYPNSKTEINVGATTLDKDATVEGTGVKQLQTGTSQIVITGVAQDGKTTKEYTLKVTREKSNNSLLDKLEVQDFTLTPKFDTQTLEYSIGDVPMDVDQLVVIAQSSDPNSVITYYINDVLNPSNTFTLPKAAGDGKIKVRVTAEDETFKEYIINYDKNNNNIDHNNNYLKDLQTNVETINFSKTKNDYSIDVKNNITSIDVTAVKDHESSIMAINDTVYPSPYTLTINDLKEGENKVTIAVTSKNGDVNTYILLINRAKANDEKITSIKYGHTIDEKYIRTVTVDTTGLDMKNQLDNDNEKLEIWTFDNTTKIEDNAIVSTGMIVKLIIDKEVKDQKTIVVIGDVNMDGKVTLPDAVLTVNHFLEIKPLVEIELVAADTNQDGTIKLPDAVKIVNHFLTIESLN